MTEILEKFFGFLIIWTLVIGICLEFGSWRLEFVGVRTDTRAMFEVS